MPRPNGITARERKFCVAYLATLNKTRALKMAGYAERADYAGELLNRPVVQDMMKRIIQETCDELGISPYWILRKLKIMVDEGVTTYDDDSVQIKNPGMAMSAIQEINKMAGNYAPVKQETQHTFDRDNLKDLIDEHTKDY